MALTRGWHSGCLAAAPRIVVACVSARRSGLPTLTLRHLLPTTAAVVDHQHLLQQQGASFATPGGAGALPHQSHGRLGKAASGRACPRALCPWAATLTRHASRHARRTGNLPARAHQVRGPAATGRFGGLLPPSAAMPRCGAPLVADTRLCCSPPTVGRPTPVAAAALRRPWLVSPDRGHKAPRSVTAASSLAVLPPLGWPPPCPSTASVQYSLLTCVVYPPLSRPAATRLMPWTRSASRA